MGRRIMTLGFVGGLLFSAGSSRAAMFSLQHPVKDAAAGVFIDPTGPAEVPFLPGLWEVLGGSPTSLSTTDDARNYTGSATFAQSQTSVTLEVSRLNNSAWKNEITVTAFDGKKRVALQQADLAPVGNTTMVTLTAPVIDQIRWHGDGWVFNPYFISGILLTPASPEAGSPPPPKVGASGPQVGSSPSLAPEPDGIFGYAVGGMALLLRRRRAHPHKIL